MGIDLDDLSTARLALQNDAVAVARIHGDLAYSLGVLLSKCNDSDSEEKAREIIDNLPADLIAGVDRDGRTVRLLEMYQGRASLRSWMTVVALSRLKSWWRSPDYARRLKARDQQELTDLLEKNLAAKSELTTDSNVVALFAEALTEALRALPPRSSVCLRLVYLHNVEQQRLAGMLQCHPSNISRDLAHAQESIKKRVLWNLRVMDPYLDIRWEDCVQLLAARPGLIAEAL